MHAELKLQIEPVDEILVIDDFSPDPLPDFACKCTRVIQPPEKLFPHIYRLDTLRNIGIKNAANDCVVILDPDCLVNPDFVESTRTLFDPSILYSGAIDKLDSEGHVALDRRVPNRVSGWIDYNRNLATGSLVWGGCMMFSKAHALMVGGFSEAFDGAWGAEEHDFASKMFHSGVRLYYSMELQVTHLQHPKNPIEFQRNRELWNQNVTAYPMFLSRMTPYKPTAGVSVITMLRPDLIDQCIRGVFRNALPLKLKVTVNGDTSPETRAALSPWTNRWAVRVDEVERSRPAKVRNEALNWAKGEGYKYLIQIDDDVVPYSNGLTALVSAMEDHPEVYACSGYLRGLGDTPKQLGGPLQGGAFNCLKVTPGVHKSDWVGGGFTIHRLSPLILYDEDYETGYNDYDWSMAAKAQGMKLAACGDAGGYHGVAFTPDGPRAYRSPPEYSRIRYNNERHGRMRQVFKEKWGFEPREGKTVD